jgi:hypothetical protein
MRGFLFLSMTLVLVGFQGLLADDAPSPEALKIPAVKKAETEYKTAVAALDKEYQAKLKVAQSQLKKELDKAKESSTKSGKLEEALAIRDRLKQLMDAQPAPVVKKDTAREKLAAEVVDRQWTGSPVWGKFVLKADGSAGFEKLPLKQATWAVVAADAVTMFDTNGDVDLLIFDKERATVKGFYFGRARQAMWEGTAKAVAK